MRVVLVVCLILLSATVGLGAEEQKTTVSFDYKCYDFGEDTSNLSCFFTFDLIGTINNVMLERFRLALAEVPTSRAVGLSVNIINSPGGSIRSAMEIGRIIRQREMTIRAIGPCASACVLVFAGGVHRYTGPPLSFDDLPGLPDRIGVHRPYIVEIPQKAVTLAEVQQQTDRTVATLRSYLQEMNVSGRLADDMMTIPPEQIRWLTPSEQNDYGLIDTDPVWQETQDLSKAQKLGISRVEYMKRRELAGRLCHGTPGAPAGCYDRVLQTGR